MKNYLHFTRPDFFSRCTIFRQIESGFSLIELIATVTIFVILLAIVFPTMAAMRDRGNSVRATANIKKELATWVSYAGDNNNILMPSFSGWDSSQTWWVECMALYHPDEIDSTKQKYGFLLGPAKGPVEKAAGFGSWLALNQRIGTTYNAQFSQERILRMHQIKHPSKTVVFADALWEQYCVDGYGLETNLTFRYNNGTSSLFGMADGHVEMAVTRRKGSPPIASSAFAPAEFIYDPIVDIPGR